MNRKHSNRPVYRERSFDNLRRRLNPGGEKSLQRFFDLMERALAGDAAPLCRYVIEHDLGPSERIALAWMIAVGFQHGRAGRREDTVSRGPHADAFRSALAEIKRRKSEWRTRARRVRVPGRVEALIVKRVVEQPRFRGLLDGQEATLINAVDRGKKKKLGP